MTWIRVRQQYRNDFGHSSYRKFSGVRGWRAGMAKALSEQMDLPESQALSFEERLGLLVDREMTVRSDRRLTTRLRQAKLRLSASLEDIDYRHPRGLDKSLMLRLASCQWVHDRHNVLITGPTGIGKTWLACAL